MTVFFGTNLRSTKYISNKRIGQRCLDVSRLRELAAQFSAETTEFCHTGNYAVLLGQRGKQKRKRL